MVKLAGHVWGAAQDMQVIRSLFKNTMAAIDILGEDAQFKLEIQKKYDKLAPMKISPRTGRLQEWNDDWAHLIQIADRWLMDGDLLLVI